MTLMLYALLIISLVPVQYTTSAIIETQQIKQKLNDISNIDDLTVRSDRAILDDIIKTALSNETIDYFAKRDKFEHRKEYNPAIDANRPKVIIFYEYLKKVKHPKTHNEIKAFIRDKVKKNTAIKIISPRTFAIYHTSSSKHLARYVANSMAQALEKSNENNYRITKKAQLPEKISFPNILFCLYCAAAISGVIAILLTIGIKPQDEKTENDD